MNNLEQKLLNLRAEINNLYWKKDELITNIDLLKKDIANYKLQRNEKRRKLKLVKFNFDSLKFTSIINGLCILIMIIFPNLPITIVLLFSSLIFGINSIYLYNSTPKNRRNAIFKLSSVKQFINNLDYEVYDLGNLILDTQISINDSNEDIVDLGNKIKIMKDIEVDYINSLYKNDVDDHFIVEEKEKTFVKKR